MGLKTNLYGVISPYYSYMYDGRGDVSVVLDSNQNLVASYKYDPFGVLTLQMGTLTQPYMFSTKRYFSSLGLSYYGYRFYNPAIGRWMTRDPMGEVADVSLYRFVGNTPLDLIDPYGLFGTGVIGEVMLGVGAAIALIPGGEVAGGIIAGVGAGLMFYEYLTLPEDRDNAVNAIRQNGFDQYFRNISTNCSQQ